jgi:hypothetical protein
MGKNKTLFFTATPKNSNDIMMYEPLNHITINNEDFEFIDDNSCIYEEPHCGKMIYEYMHIDGVNDNILNDFKAKYFNENFNILFEWTSLVLYSFESFNQ